MFDVVTYALVKKMIGQAATGISKVEYKDSKLIFTLVDGSTLETALDISSGVAGASLDENGALVIEFSDGTSLTYAATQVLVDAKAYTDKKIQELNYTDTEITKNVVTAVDEQNGVIATTRKPLSDIAWSGEVVDLKQTDTTIILNCGTSTDFWTDQTVMILGEGQLDNTSLE